MGFEYHDRKRDWRGRFDREERNAQIHIYCNANQWRTIKAAALIAAEDLSSYCRNAALARAKRELLETDISENGN